MKSSMEAIVERVARRVTPTRRERGRVRSVLDEFMARARHEADARGLSVRVEVEGSIAKDTWISSDRDLDVFLIFPPGTEREVAGRLGLELAKASAGGRWSLGYAEHPYVEAEMGGFTLDIVPSVEMREGERPTTSVDRTPLHTRFVIGRLGARGRMDVRVLKQFLKGVGIYGAELKVGGFSGYLAELLVIHFGSFVDVVRAAAGWGVRTTIDTAGHYRGQDLADVFEGNLVIVDPVDMSRNAAAAVSTQSYFSFVAAARHFVEEPRIDFFFPRRGPANPEAVLRLLRKKGSHLLAVVISCPRVPSDILWGEAYRSMRKISAALEGGGFPVNDSAVWSDERTRLVFLFELQALEIGRGRLHLGPMISLVEEGERFLAKYRSGRGVLAGPYIRGDRWVVELPRGENSAAPLLKSRLRRIKLSEDVGRELKKGHRVLVDDQLEWIMEEEPELAAFAKQFLRKRPPWLSR